MTKQITSAPKILCLDIETAPAIVYSWGLFDVTVGINQVIKDGYVLMWAAKWVGQKTIYTDTLYKHGVWYHNNIPDLERNEHHIAKSIWKLVDEADAIVTHNGDDFDLKWLNTMFIKHHLPPVSNFKSIDTKKIAKSTQRFMSNKLDFIARKLDLGRKIDTNGFELWDECIKGKKAAWNRMETYCKHDVRLLERVYLKLRPFIKSLLNYGLFNEKTKPCCPNCGSFNIVKRGWSYTAVSKFQRLICTDCGKSMRANKRVSGAKTVGL